MAEWWRGAVLYQIYPRSFRDSNGDGIGDLPGIAASLDHVAALGVDGLWLSPFFPSPMKDFGYDVSDYVGVDPMFGTLADFDALLVRAHGLGLKVLIDQVYSHTSDVHPWFVESRAARANPKADWYVWADAKPDGSPPNNWQAVFGGPAWEWDPRRRQYYLHNFLVEQPDLNLHHPEVQDAIFAAARFWLDRGVDGLRLDVANFYMHDPLLRDNPAASAATAPDRPYHFQRHVYDRSRPETLTFMSRLRALLDSYPDRMAVGEIEDDDPLARQIEYTDGPDRLHTAYSFFLLRANPLNAEAFRRALEGWRDGRGWPSWSLENHDVLRFPSRLSDPPADAACVKVFTAALLAMRGTIFLYQGQELGLPHAEVPAERLRDPDAIRFGQGDSGRDGARTPMPWRAAEAMAGFTNAADAWLPLDPKHAALAVDVQDADPDSMMAFVRAFLTLRRSSPALRAGALTIVDAPEPVLAFERVEGDERLLCLFNLTAEPQRVVHPDAERLAPLASGLDAQVSEGAILLSGFGGGVFRYPA